MLEVFGVITGLLYMVLEIRQHRTMWIVGFITSLVYVFVFFFAKLYADMGLQAYYVLISVYGFWLWSRKRGEREEVKGKGEEESAIIYSHASVSLLMGVTVAMVILWFILYYVLSRYTDSPVPVGDALTTAIGIVATWMLARRIIEHWYFWMIANLTSIYIYYLRDLYPTMFLYLCYTVIAVVGLYTWSKKGIRTDDKTL